MNENEIKRRLRWKARRGMLELDLALNRFLDSGYDRLNPMQQQRFDELLDQEDDVLYGWIFGHHAVLCRDTAELISLICNAVNQA